MRIHIINRASILKTLSRCPLKISIHDLYSKMVNNNTSELKASKFVKLLHGLRKSGLIQIIYAYDGQLFWKISEFGKRRVSTNNQLPATNIDASIVEEGTTHANVSRLPQQFAVNSK